MSETSHGSDSKCAVFPRSRRMFYIPRTCFQLVQKIFQGLSKSKTSKKHVEYSELSRACRDSIFQKMKKIYFSSNIKCLRRRTVLIRNALCSLDLGECFTYPEHVFNLSRKFSRDSQSQKLPKKKSRRMFSGETGLVETRFSKK